MAPHLWPTPPTQAVPLRSNFFGHDKKVFLGLVGCGPSLVWLECSEHKRGFTPSRESKSSWSHKVNAGPVRG